MTAEMKKLISLCGGLSVECRTVEDRNAIVKTLIELDPNVTTDYISLKYSPTAWPWLFHHGGNTWALYSSNPREKKIVSTPEFLFMCELARGGEAEPENAALHHELDEII